MTISDTWFQVLASAKPDFIWIDVEHGMFNRLTLHE
jgi:4-hydroxy-2-oxoheptanedioate aldolase